MGFCHYTFHLWPGGAGRRFLTQLALIPVACAGILAVMRTGIWLMLVSGSYFVKGMQNSLKGFCLQCQTGMSMCKAGSHVSMEVALHPSMNIRVFYHQRQVRGCWGGDLQ